MALFFTAALVAATPRLLAFDMSQSTRCVTIPDRMRLCKDVGYSEMRLPNFLGHSDLEKEVVPRSEDWRPLLQTGCHPEAQAFLCSIVAPVCLDTFVQPCRSLCEAVKDSCAPALACQGLLWPEAFRCDRFPTDEDVCLTPHGKFNRFFKDLPKPVCQSCPTVELSPAVRTVLRAFCHHDFAVTARLHCLRHSTGALEFQVQSPVEFIRRGPLWPHDTQRLLQEWLLINPRCAGALVRPGRSQLYVLTGSVLPSGVIALTRLFPWHKKEAGVTVATRRWKHHRC